MEGQEGPGSGTASAAAAAAATDVAGASAGPEADGLWVPDEYVEVGGGSSWAAAGGAPAQWLKIDLRYSMQQHLRPDARTVGVPLQMEAQAATQVGGCPTLLFRCIPEHPSIPAQLQQRSNALPVLRRPRRLCSWTPAPLKQVVLRLALLRIKLDVGGWWTTRCLVRCQSIG
jgi:hypothetical protein